MFNYMINNMRAFMFVAGVAGAFALLASNNAMAASAKADMHVWEPGTTNWGQWQCDPDGTADDDFLRWPDATATVHIKQKNGKTHLQVKVRDAAPDVLWTVWFIHSAAGASPLTGSRVTPMANPSEVPELITMTPHLGLIPELEPFGDDSADEAPPFPVGVGPFEQVGAPDAPNVFFTNSSGKGTFNKYLDFTLINGAYPYPDTAAFIEDAFDVVIEGMEPLATNTAPSTQMAIVSHCFDDAQAAHGLLSYTDERWFALQVDPFEE